MRDAIAFVPVLALLLGIVSTAGGFFLYYSGSVRKKYAAERDFQHLRANQETIVQMLRMLDDDVSDVKMEMIRQGSTFHDSIKSPRSDGGTGDR